MNRLYREFIKRLLDFVLALVGIIVLSPILVIVSIVGGIFLKGNPFFLQERPGKNGKIFKLIKFRTMSNEKDEKGDLLPADERLIPYGKFLRSTSIDELPELFNILKGDMAIVGPRPLLPKYLSLYNKEQQRRHEILPGLTGYAQVHGRNDIDWSKRLAMDVWYVDNYSFVLDCKILIKTVLVIFKRDGITSSNAGQTFMTEFKGDEN